MKNKLLFFIVTVLGLMAFISSSAENYSGSLGEDIQWVLDSETGGLEITGIGSMPDYDYWGNYVPWYSYSTIITSINISNGVSTIGNYVFDNCSALTEITLPNSIVSIGDGSFTNCTSLTNVNIQENLNSIGEGAFWGCSSLSAITIPSSVSSIGADAFRGCTSLPAIYVHLENRNYCDVDGVLFNKDQTILIRYPAGKKDVNYNIPNSVTSFENWAFSGCPYLSSVVIPASISSISDQAFNGCSALSSVMIQGNVTSIGTAAFYCCYSLTSLYIPNSVHTIGGNAFLAVPNVEYTGSAKGSPWGASSINGFVEDYLVYKDDSKTNLLACSAAAKDEVKILASVTDIRNEAFPSTNSITSIKVEINNANYCDIDGVLFNKDKTILVKFPSGKGKTYSVPNGTITIGGSAFRGCPSITSVTFPNSLDSIGSSSFYECKNITSITCEAITPPTWHSSSSVYGMKNGIPVYVPTESVEIYRQAEGWKKFTNIQSIQAEEAAVTDIQAEPADNSVVIEWPAVAEATVYTIEIKKNGELICTLTFNELGQLQNIAFAKPARNGGRDSQVRTATLTTTGWQYTVGGLEANTEYTYTVMAKKNASDMDNLYNKTITFTTKNTPTDIDAVIGADSQSKQIRNGQLLILSNGGTYNAQGVRVE